MIDILYEDNHLLVVKKPANIPVQADSSHDVDLLSLCKEDLKIRYQKPGNVYLGLVHRLDRMVSGVMVFAKTSKAASRLSTSLQHHEFEKDYLAIVEGSLPDLVGKLEDYMAKNQSQNKSYITSHKEGKYAALEYQLIQTNKEQSLYKIHLLTGRSHQIRLQFASRNHPLIGDHKYHTTPQEVDICLFAYHLSFPHPITKQILHFTLDYPTTYPWNQFQKGARLCQDEKEDYATRSNLSYMP